MFGYSLTRQTMIQKQMNETMAVINDSIQSTGNVIQQTSHALQPLYDTTEALAAVEQREERTVADLASMNAHLSQIGKTEQRIIQDLGRLNSISSDVSNLLSSLAATNQQLLGSGYTSILQASQEGNQIMTLNQMTRNSINQLKELNEKLAPLRLLP
jgi:hypothetical protein